MLYLDEVGSEELREVIQLIKNNHPEWKIGMAGFHTPSDFVDSNVYDMSLMVGIDGNPGRNVSDKVLNFLHQLQSSTSQQLCGWRCPSCGKYMDGLACTSYELQWLLKMGFR